MRQLVDDIEVRLAGYSTAYKHAYAILRDQCLNPGSKYFPICDDQDIEKYGYDLAAFLADIGESKGKQPYLIDDWIDDFGDGCIDEFLPDYYDQNPDARHGYWGTSRESTDGVVYFASGTNLDGEIQGADRGGHHLGVAVPELSRHSHWALHTRTGTTKIFVDSGAFSEVGFGPNGPFIAREITHDEWVKRLDAYLDLSGALGKRLFVVAPDCVAHQKETFERLERYAATVRRIARGECYEHAKHYGEGSNVIVPVQKGEVPMAEFWHRATTLLGLPNLIAGIPMKKDATTVSELEEFVRVARPDRIHLLGLGPESHGFAAAIAAIRKHCPDCSITCDSVLLRRLVGRTNGRGGGPRVLTQRRDELIAAGWNPEHVSSLKEAMTASTLLDRDAGQPSLLTRRLLKEGSGDEEGQKETDAEGQAQ